MTTEIHATTPAPQSRALETTHWLALGTVAGPVLLTVAWFVLGFLSPGFTIFGTQIAPYSPVSAAISGLGLGPTAPFMNAAFVLNGLLLAVGVVGTFHSIREMSAVARWSCIVLLGLAPLGSIMDGIFTLESFLPHSVGFGLSVGAPILSFLITGLLLRRIPRWRRFANRLLLGSPLTLALLILYFATFSPTAEGAKTGVAGLTERILIVEVLAWFAAMGWLAFRSDGRQEP